MQKKAFVFMTATASLLAASGIATTPVSAATFLSFTSAADYIGGGRTATFTPADGYFKYGNSNSTISFSFNSFNGNDWWFLDLAAPSNTTLAPGTYAGATRYPFQSPAEPGLSFDGNGRGCNTLTGSFNVLEAVYNSENEIQRFGADFEQYCEGADPALLGQIRFDRAEFDQANLAKLMELSDKIKQFDTALYFWSQPGDPIRGGLEEILTPANVDFKVSRNFDNGVSFSLNNFSRAEPQNYIWWYLDFAAPENAILAPGLYDRATRFPFQSSNRPGLDLSGNGRGCNRLGGRFKILETTYGSDEQVESFDALFEQHCEDELATGPALFGRIRYNATVEQPPNQSVPEPTTILGLLSIGGLLLTQRRQLLSSSKK